MNILLKSCRICKQGYPETSFHKNKTYKSGRENRCKKCHAAYSIAYARKHKKQAVATRKKFYDTHGGYAYHKKYAKTHLDYVNARNKTDINFRLAGNLRARLRKVITHGYKSAKTLELLGCTIYELKDHLEDKFTGDMSWENYGEWHIDHIKPCAKFDLTKEAEQRQCFRYSNLQPLWAYDNIVKSDNFYE